MPNGGPTAGAPDRPVAGAGIDHVVIVGLMGSGKSTVGRRVAADLGWPVHDSDAEIEAATGRTVRELRDELGVDAMHGLEFRQLLDALAAPGPSVVCPAASIIDDPACRAALAAPGVLVAWLRVSPAVAARRFASGSHRPWYGDDPATFFARLAGERDPRYRVIRDLELDADAGDPAALAAVVVAAVHGHRPAGAQGWG